MMELHVNSPRKILLWRLESFLIGKEILKKEAAACMAAG
jgi:hypothetical protein